LCERQKKTEGCREARDGSVVEREPAHDEGCRETREESVVEREPANDEGCRETREESVVEREPVHGEIGICSLAMTFFPRLQPSTSSDSFLPPF
jgi:hypothetical protein